MPDELVLQEDLGLGRAHLARLPADIKTAALPDTVVLLSYPADRWYFLALNNDHPVLRDGAVRRALALALDRERLLAAALGGQGALMDAPWLATHWAIAGASLAPLAYAWAILPLGATSAIMATRLINASLLRVVVCA